MVFLVWGRAAENIEKKEKTDRRKTKERKTKNAKKVKEQQ